MIFFVSHWNDRVTTRRSKCVKAKIETREMNDMIAFVFVLWIDRCTSCFLFSFISIGRWIRRHLERQINEISTIASLSSSKYQPIKNFSDVRKRFFFLLLLFNKTTIENNVISCFVDWFIRYQRSLWVILNKRGKTSLEKASQRNSPLNAGTRT